MSLVQQSTAMAEKARDFYAQKLVEYEMKYQHPKNSQSAAYFGISEVLTGRENEFEFVPEPDEFELGEDVTEIGSKPVSRDPLIRGLLD